MLMKGFKASSWGLFYEYPTSLACGVIHFADLGLWLITYHKVYLQKRAKSEGTDGLINLDTSASAKIWYCWRRNQNTIPAFDTQHLNFLIRDLQQPLTPSCRSVDFGPSLLQCFQILAKRVSILHHRAFGGDSSSACRSTNDRLKRSSLFRGFLMLRKPFVRRGDWSGLALFKSTSH